LLRHPLWVKEEVKLHITPAQDAIYELLNSCGPPSNPSRL
jgi:hypothetical protein